MPHGRRQILKTMSAVGAGSLATIGTVGANENCVETLATHTRSEGAWAGVSSGGEAVAPSTPVVAGAGLVAPYDTTPFDIESGTFEESDLEGKRIQATMTWNPVEAGPNNANLFVDQQTSGGGWEVIGYGESADVLGGNVQGENRVEVTVADGDVYSGSNASGDSVNNEAIVAGGRTYRVRPQNGTGVADFQIDIEVQAFDPECGGDE